MITFNIERSIVPVLFCLSLRLRRVSTCRFLAQIFWFLLLLLGFSTAFIPKQRRLLLNFSGLFDFSRCFSNVPLVSLILFSFGSSLLPFFDKLFFLSKSYFNWNHLFSSLNGFKITDDYFPNILVFIFLGVNFEDFDFIVFKLDYHREELWFWLECMGPYSPWSLFNLFGDVGYHLVLSFDQHILLIHLYSVWATRTSRIKKRQCLALGAWSQIFSCIWGYNVELIDESNHLFFFGLLDVIHLSINNHSLFLVSHENVVTNFDYVEKMKRSIQLIAKLLPIYSVNIKFSYAELTLILA